MKLYYKAMSFYHKVMTKVNHEYLNNAMMAVSHDMKEQKYCIKASNVKGLFK